jgi:hypothetical protein
LFFFGPHIRHTRIYPLNPGVTESHELTMYHKTY